LVRWDALCRYVEDGHVELAANTVERAIRPIALGRKNHLYAGSDGGTDRWAIVCSLIITAKLNDREPYAYLKGRSRAHWPTAIRRTASTTFSPGTGSPQPDLGARNGRLLVH
jgi:hypothetical protein